MKFKINEWPLVEIYKRRDKIDFPIFQREAIWSERQNIDLVDSIFMGIDIPKIYLQKIENKGWDCIDGQQRIKAIIGFFNGDFEYKGEKFENLTEEEKSIFENYKMTIAEIEEINDDEVRILFLRLQLGVPTNSGEKLNAIRSNVGKFVIEISKMNFIENLSIPSRRYAKQQICAQICNNSIYINKSGIFRSSKFDDLEILYKTLNNLSLDSNEFKKIREILEKLNKIFGEKAVEIRNRASAVSLYLFFERFEEKIAGKEDKFRDFYLVFLERLKEESQLGIDAKNRFLINYQNKIIQGADSRSAIQFRNESLEKAFQYYLEKGKIIED